MKNNRRYANETINQKNVANNHSTRFWSNSLPLAPSDIIHSYSSSHSTPHDHVFVCTDNNIIVETLTDLLFQRNDSICGMVVIATIYSEPVPARIIPLMAIGVKTTQNWAKNDKFIFIWFSNRRES